jgi:hypothetical protein
VVDYLAKRLPERFRWIGRYTAHFVMFFTILRKMREVIGATGFHSRIGTVREYSKVIARLAFAPRII